MTLGEVFAQQVSFGPGQTIEISCPVRSKCSEQVRIKLKVTIYEGSIMPGHGTQIAQYESSPDYIAPGETVAFSVRHTTVEGTIDRRDISVDVYRWDGSKWVTGEPGGKDEWDDIYYVAAVYDFELKKPTISAV